jgi:DNA-binding IclR family transcriptional regulator
MVATTSNGIGGHSQSVDDVLAQVPNVVAVVTLLTESGPIGTVLSGLVRLASEPPRLLLVGPEATALGQQVRPAGTCWVSILADGQSDLVEAFMSASEPAPGIIPWQTESDLPAIPKGIVGWIECTVDDVVRRSESFVAFATPSTSRLERDARPMVGFQGGFGGFLPTALTAATRPGMEETLRIARVAQDQIELIAQEIGTECSVIGYDNGDQVALAVANYSPTARVTQIGEKFPVIPPIGVLFVDSSETGLTEEHWLSRTALAGSGDHSEWIEMARAQLARVKERGWSIMIGGPRSPRDLDEVVSAAVEVPPGQSPPPEFVQSVRTMAASHEPETIDDDEVYDVYTLAVPVRAASGDTIVTLRLIGLPPQARGSEVRLWLSLLQQAARTVEAQLRTDQTSY